MIVSHNGVEKFCFQRKQARSRSNQDRNFRKIEDFANRILMAVEQIKNVRVSSAIAKLVWKYIVNK
jgi:hypothetical protein